jgi:hypothetical protein
MFNTVTVRNTCEPMYDRNVNNPLRLKRGVAERVLSVPQYKAWTTENLIELAAKRLPGSGVSDRATAIAILLGAKEVDGTHHS